MAVTSPAEDTGGRQIEIGKRFRPHRNQASTSGSIAPVLPFTPATSSQPVQLQTLQRVFFLVINKQLFTGQIREIDDIPGKETNSAVSRWISARFQSVRLKWPLIGQFWSQLQLQDGDAGKHLN